MGREAGSKNAAWDDSVELVWEEPPLAALNPRQAKSYWMVLTEKLRARPGEWLRSPRQYSDQGGKQTVQGIRNGKYTGMTKGEFEAAQHEGVVWIRYVGLPEDGQPSRPTLVPTTPPRRNPRKSTSENADVNRQIREWASDQGIEMPAFGRIPQDIKDRWNAHMDEQEAADE